MSRKKYIILKDSSVIIFSQNIAHNEMAHHFGGKENVASAGQVSSTADENQIGAYGDSFSLKIGSTPEDSRKIFRELSIYA